MRENIEFDAPIEDGKIIVPQKYEQVVRHAVRVHVTVSTESSKERQPDFFDEVRKTPIHAPHFERLTRDQMHER